MSDEQKSIDDGKRWQVDYDCNLIWNETIKSEVDLNNMKRLFSYLEKVYDIMEGSFINSQGPYYTIRLKSKDDWTSTPQIDSTIQRNFLEESLEINVALLTIQKDTRENGKKGNDKIVTSNLKDHTNSIKLRCQGNLFYEDLDNKIVIARYSYEASEQIDKSLFVAFPQEIIGDGQKSYRVSCSNLQKARRYGIFADPSSELKEVIFTAENIGVYLANRELLHGIYRVQNNENLDTEELEGIEEKRISIEFKNKYNRIIFGAPGTGKSYRLYCDSDVFEGRTERVTFHPNYSYAQFVGTYKPIQGEIESEIKYEFVPGPFMRIYTNAIKHPENDYLLLIEEVNRANVAAVFGDVFQLLDRKNGKSEYEIAVSEDIRKHLLKELSKNRKLEDCNDDEKKKCTIMSLPDNMYIWATMNSADQGVFPMDTAFKRRWEFEYIGVDDEKQIEAIKDYFIPMCMNDDKRYYVKWQDLRNKINEILSGDDCKVNEDKLLGPFFISKNSLEEINRTKELRDNAFKDSNTKIDINDVCTAEKDFLKSFESKVIMYIFEDVMKMNPKKIFTKHTGKMIFSEICKSFENVGEVIFGIDDLQQTKYGE